MQQRKRLEEIRQTIRREREVSVAALSRQYDVTEETIRRDLEKLKAEGLVSRTYGGAVLAVESVLENVDFYQRAQVNHEAKQLIGSLAASVIPRHVKIGADASSTVMEALLALGDRSDTIVLTNSVRAISLAEQCDIRIMSTGGMINRHSSSMQGPKARAALEEYFLDVILIGCTGLNLSGGVFDSNEEEALWKKHLLRRGSKVILLADHSKFDQVAFVQITDLKAVDMVITDRRPSDEWLKKLREFDVVPVWEVKNADKAS